MIFDCKFILCVLETHINYDEFEEWLAKCWSLFSIHNNNRDDQNIDDHWYTSENEETDL